MAEDQGQVVTERVVSGPAGSLQLRSLTEQDHAVPPAALAMSVSHQCQQGQQESTSIDQGA